MFSNYFKTAWRTIIRNKTFSALNILGLALGLCCSMFIFLWVNDERNVDGFHKNGSQLYQVYERNFFDGKTEANYNTQGLLAGELKRVIPEVQYASGFEYVSAPGSQSNFEAAGKTGKRLGMFAGNDFFSMFSYPLLQGSVQSALLQPGGIAISENMANYFFGNPSKALGSIMRFEDKEELKVTAVFTDIPANSSQKFDFLRSWTDFEKQNEWVKNWGNKSPQTFVQLRPNADAAKTEIKLKDFIYRYQPKGGGIITQLALQPYTQKYLHGNFKDGYIDGGRIEYVQLFSIVAVFILLIACINFMNLATARSVKRAKEVGVRKVVGALKRSLIAQFIGEAILLTLLSVVIAIIAAALMLPAFNALTGKSLLLPVNTLWFWCAMLGLMLFTGIIAGSYPAFFLSSLQPVRVLKGSLKFSWSSLFLRKGLVVFQFALSAILMISTVIVYQQLQYIQTKNIGYNRDNLIYIPIEGDLVSKYALFKQAATASTSIVSISKMRNSPTVIEHHTNGIDWAGKNPDVDVHFADGVVGYDFTKTMKIKLVDGRDFSPAFADSTSFLLNETAVQKIGFKNPIGQTITWGQRKGTVVGIVQDFHFSSLHEAVEPLILRLDESWGWGNILVRVKSGQTKAALDEMEKICRQINPKFSFTYQFSNLEYARLYNSEQVVSKVSNLFAFIAIFISSLGLFGLAMFAAEQRKKEIGLRKVLGATASNIVTLLSVNFLKPVGIALLIAFPVAWYATNLWLQRFVYRIQVGWWVFAVVGATALLIAFCTISLQTIKAAIANPVKSLRSE